MNRPRLHRATLSAVGSVVTLVLTACGADEPPRGSASGSPTAASTPSDAQATEPEAGEPFGEGCAAVADEGEGEGDFQGMADQPVATALSGTPALSRLAEAIAAAELAAAFDGADDVTVLAPANAAFEAVPADVLDPVLGDTPQLTALLTHHVLEGRLGPGELAGEQTTLNGGTVTIEGSGEDFSIPAEGTVLGESPARVICGNVQTANATVYVIDQLLTPPAA